ncbi:MAG: RNA polymerase sigma factor [Nanoarchaeota archaeon]|nr:RNA polymerase sigma factor [Nanoarchaeota archaeon]
MPLEQTLKSETNISETDSADRASKLDELLGCYSFLLKKARGLKKGKHEDAEDLVSKTYFNAIKYINRYEAGSNPYAWLGRIMTNISLNEFNAKKVHEIPFTDYFGGADYGEFPAAANTEQDVVSKLSNFSLAKAITALPDNYRTVFVAHNIQGLDYQNISETLGIPMGTVKSRISRAKDMLASNPSIIALAEYRN